ncbi:MAG: hypothetical protein AB1449_14015 [Chloroflexota bacterium]
MSDLSTTLDACLERLAAGEAIDLILLDHPAFADPLRPLLAAAAAFDRSATPPRDSWRAQARRTLLKSMPPRLRRTAIPRQAIWRRVATGAVAGALAFLSVGTAAAQAALPGDALFGWKLTSEQVWRALSAEPLEVELALLERRTEEWIRLRGESRQAEAEAHFHEQVMRLELYRDPDQQASIAAALACAFNRLEEAGLPVQLPRPSDEHTPPDATTPTTTPGTPLPGLDLFPTSPLPTLDLIP